MAGQVSVRPAVFLALRDHSELSRHVAASGHGEGVFVPGDRLVASGQEVELEIAFAREQLSVSLRGIVRWRRAASNAHLPAGVGIELLPADKRARDLWRELVAGRMDGLVKRQSRRFPVSLEVSCADGALQFSGVIDDLSREGACIHARRAPAVGRTIRLLFNGLPNAAPVELSAEVRWWNTSATHAFGVRFDHDQASRSAALRELLEHVKREVSAGPGRHGRASGW